MPDNMSETTGFGPPSGVATKLFQASKPPPSAQPAVLAIFEPLTDRLGRGLDAFTSLTTTLALESLTRGYPADVAVTEAAVVAASAFIPQWNGFVQIHYDRLFLSRGMEAMFGGNAARPMSAPTRELTALETALVMSMTDVVLQEIQVAFNGVCDISFADIACSGSQAGGCRREDSANAVVARFRRPEFGDALCVALPAVGVDLIADTPSTRDDPDVPGLDPRWTRDLQRTLAGTPMRLVAVAHAPSISIGDVAALRPGSLLEFDAACLNGVRLHCADQAVLVGRLGQSKGRYTLSVESMTPAPTDRDEL